jgi:radical SAM protein with 4Fe4S-binding SPASM domain
MATEYPLSNGAEMGDAHDGASHLRPHSNGSGQSEERAGSPTTTRHVLEDILAQPVARRFLGWLSVTDGNGCSRLERICETYDRANVAVRDKFKWALPHLAIDWGLRRTGASKEIAKAKLFHHHPTVRALALTARSIARYGLSAPQRFAAPLFVVWNITRACNLECQHCYENATHKPQRDELTLGEKIGIIDELATAGVPFMAIAGGEPLVCKDLWPVIQYAHKRDIHLTIATNGTMITPEVATRLIESGVKYVEVSIDSIHPGEHDAFRRRQGSWAKSIQGIKNLVAAGMRTGLAMCFTRETYRSVDEAVHFATDLGCKTFSHFNFIPAGRGTEITRSDLSPRQREWLIRRLAWHLQEGKINVISTAPQFGRACIAYGSPEGLFAIGHVGRGPGKQTLVLARYIGGCGAGRCYCAIQPNGEVTPCVYIPSLVVGNLRNQKLGRIRDCGLFRLLSDRADRGGRCRTCDFRPYCGGCRARALAYTGSITEGNPGCIYNRAESQEAPRTEGWHEPERDVELPGCPKSSHNLTHGRENALHGAATMEERGIAKS